jgi:hypothetical protein
LTTAVATQQVPARDRTPPVPTSGAASLSGTVMNDATGRPLRHATVGLFSTDNGLRLAVITGDDGTFGFSDLPAGKYSVTAGKVGYVGIDYGAKRIGRPGTPITIADGEKKTGVTLRLPAGAVISGTVRSATGEPMPGARVIVLRRSVRFDTGEPTLVRADSGASGFGLGDTTDERGVYRWYGLPADDYYVVVVPAGPLIRNAGEIRQLTSAEIDWAARVIREPNGTPIATPPPAPGPAVDYAPVFYPGASTVARASTISVKAGEERDGVDIVVDLVPTATITGTVSMPGGGPLPGLAVNLIAHDTIPGIPFSGFGNARVDRQGRFVSGGLVPGDYTIMVRPATQGPMAPGEMPPSALFGISTVTVNGADVDVPVALQTGVTVSGRVVFDGSAPPSKVAGIRVSLVVKRTSAPSLGLPAGMTDATGAFTFTGVAPGSYHLAATGAPGWQMKSASGGGQEALDGFIDVGGSDITDATVTFTDKSTEVSGALVDAAGRPAPDYTIIIFPADQKFWEPLARRIQSTKPASDGHFRVANLPPGDYRIAAVTDVEQGEWYSPSFLAELVGASRAFTLAEGQKIVEDLRIAGGS